MIILFTSVQGGQAFVAATVEAVRQLQCELTIVLSGPSLRERRLLTRTRRIKRYLRDRYLAFSMSRQHGIAVRVVEDINVTKFRRFCHGSHGLVASFNQIFGEETIEVFESLTNVHASVLPYYRGPDPIRWCLSNEETLTGYTFHRLSKRVDRGRVIHQGVVPIHDGDSAFTLGERIASAAAADIPDYLAHVVKGDRWIRGIVADPVYRHCVDYAPHIHGAA